MSYDIKIACFALTLSVILVHGCLHETSHTNVENTMIPVETSTSLPVSNEKSFEMCSKITREVLITHCGSCHQSSLTTHKSGAIAIFDLDKGANWHNALSEEHLESISNRTENKTSITKMQKEAIASFIKLKAKAFKGH